MLVVYNIPELDCGLYSAGYRDWIDRLAAGIGDNPAALILEPDAIGHVDCLSAEARQIRFELLNHAVDAFEAPAAGRRVHRRRPL